MIDHREEQIKLLSKQLKLPTFANYTDILRQAKPNADFSDLLLDLLMTEANARQASQSRGVPLPEDLGRFRLYPAERERHSGVHSGISILQIH